MVWDLNSFYHVKRMMEGHKTFRVNLKQFEQGGLRFACCFCLSSSHHPVIEVVFVFSNHAQCRARQAKPCAYSRKCEAGFGAPAVAVYENSSGGSARKAETHAKSNLRREAVP